MSYNCYIGFESNWWKSNDAPLSSSMDSTANPKVKITEGDGVGACSLVRNTLGVEGHVGAPGWD
jgi:hypothetical protein